ncbi:hypothetical protein, partial [Sphingomonas sp.]|uniref:hypothetical protein n=1 Tax=Sphingomonas sp. TaxID=28214 RepID=UPI0025CDE636
MTSPSTLVRKAKAAKNPATAKRLRAQAAKLRRDIRSGTAKKAKKKKAKKVAKKVARSKTPPFTGLIAGIKKSNLDWQVYSDEAGVSRYSEICTSPQPLISDGLMDVIIGYTKSKKPEVQKQARDIIEGQAIGMFQR